MRAERDIVIVGAGYVGLTSAACFCELGRRVALVEINPARLELLQAGKCPIYEPGLAELLERHLGKNLTVTDRLEDVAPCANALFICVGTPPRENGAPDLRALRRLLRSVRSLPGRGRPVVVLKSTVPPGTNQEAYTRLGGRFPVVSNPEFLREGHAIHDFFHPDRIVVGSPDAEAALDVAGLYTGLDAPILVTGWEEAELIKYASNGLLAIKISYANEIAALCDALGADGLDVLKGVGLDQRIGSLFLAPGPGYGGSCLPKDVQGLMWKARQSKVRLDLLPAAERANSRQRLRLLERLNADLDGVAGKTVAVWGLAFKAGTDDLRGAASLELIPQLLRHGARVQAFDPAAMEGFARLFPPEKWDGLHFASDHWTALDSADALLILTEWDAFREASPQEIRRAMSGDVVLDTRNLLEPESAAAAGLHYRGVGRGRARQV